MKTYSTRAIADAIGNYLRSHPDSADTLAGIQQWWLRPLGLEPPTEIVAAALELLAAEQQVECRQIGQSRLWRLRRSND